MKNFISPFKRVALFFIATVFSASANAQFLRTSYTQDVHYSLQMNPAMVPSSGYISPLLGPVSATMQSNTFGTTDIKDIIDKGEDYYKSNDFLDKLNSDNHLNVNLSWDQISFGWYSDKNFFSFNTGTRIDLGASLPKSIFTFMNEMNGNNLDDEIWKRGMNADLSGEKLAMQVYQEIGIGYARKINDKLTVGGKVKLLLGAANMDFEVKKMSIHTPVGIDIDKIQQTYENANLDWSKYKDAGYKKDEMLKAVRNEIRDAAHLHGKAGIAVEASGKASMGGLEWEYATDEKGNNTYINNAKMNSFKIAGYGFGIDLGATYEVIDNLTVTAAVTDLGFINWSKSESKEVNVKMDQQYDLDKDEGEGGLYDFANKVANNEVVNFDMLQMKDEEADGYSTSLYTTIALGCQYRLLNDKLEVGALYTGRMAKPQSVHELTISGAYNLSAWMNIALSYSMIQSAGKSFGIGLKAGPLYVGTDYMFFGNSSRCVNLMAGLSIPLGKGKNF